ncbi:MAG: hypothetical protein FJ297_01785 [Planctomycetes bacterium]|nr:hypothetical protein [Planctomycetota bacterium]
MNGNAPKPCSAPITDSPWFWLYLFATAGLAALMLMEPRIASRQSQIERNMQGRTRAARVRAGETPSTPLSDPARPVLTLKPLHALLAALLVVAWAGLFARRRARCHSAEPPAARVGPPSHAIPERDAFPDRTC